ncbi:MAG: hypothetical protein ACI4V7_00320 [Succinivibrionaceae bacterium]
MIFFSKIVIIFFIIYCGINNSIAINNVTSKLDNETIKEFGLDKQFNHEEPSIPEGCKLISYTKDLMVFYYKCGNKDILNTLIFPTNNVSKESIVNQLLENPLCKKIDIDNLYLGTRVDCLQMNETYTNHIFLTQTGLFEVITTTSEFSNEKKLKNLANFSLITYFYGKKVVRSYEEIKKIEDILKSAIPINAIEDLFNGE